MKKVTDTVHKVLEGGSEVASCKHVASIQVVEPLSEGCQKCLDMGDTWVHLRLCLTCGHVGCCDNSKNRHATKHYYESEHPIIMSFEPQEDWVWCYPDRKQVA